MSFSHAYNTLQTLSAFPCAEPNPLIYAATLAPAIAPALMEWVSFGCRDVMKFRLGRGVMCGRALKGQASKVIPPVFKDAVNGALKWEARFSFAGQMFLLLDLETETLARWATLAYQMSGCPEANNIKTWDYKPLPPGAIPAGAPFPLAALVSNERGPPGIAFPTGAIAPPGWHVQINFEIDYQPLFSGEKGWLRTWVNEGGPHGYDYAANQYNPGYFSQKGTASYQLHTQNTDMTHSRTYTMMAQCEVPMLGYNLRGSAQASQAPIQDWSLNPLGCLKDLSVEHVEDPLNRNPRPRYPTIVDAHIAKFFPKPRRGPPGGLPRTKK